MKANNLDATVAALNAGLLAVLGVDYYATVWAFFGSCLTVTQTRTKMGRSRVVVYVLLSTLIGAALAGGAAAFLGSEHLGIRIVLGLLGGAGSQGLVTLLLEGVAGKIKALLPGETKP